MRLDQTLERHRGKHPGADLVGQRRDAEIDALALEALALAVQWNVLGELVKQDRRQQLRPDVAARRRVERRRRLGDRLAIATGNRSEEHTSELQSLMRSSYAVFCLKNTSGAHSYRPVTKRTIITYIRTLNNK